MLTSSSSILPLLTHDPALRPSPVLPQWDNWDMAHSTYTYCFHGCPVDWLVNNSASLGLGTFAGVVGVDHYWTKQGTPCVGGEPHEFAHQASLSRSWKASFPELKFMTYRILAAVPYDMVIKNKMDSVRVPV